MRIGLGVRYEPFRTGLSELTSGGSLVRSQHRPPQDQQIAVRTRATLLPCFERRELERWIGLGPSAREPGERLFPFERKGDAVSPIALGDPGLDALASASVERAHDGDAQSVVREPLEDLAGYAARKVEEVAGQQRRVQEHGIGALERCVSDRIGGIGRAEQSRCVCRELGDATPTWQIDKCHTHPISVR